MGQEVRRLAYRTDGPGNLAGGHCQRIDQHARPVSDVLMFSSLTPARLGRFGSGFASMHLHAGFSIAANYQTALLVELKRLGVELADGVGFGIKVLVVTVEPVLTCVGLEIDVLQDT